MDPSKRKIKNELVIVGSRHDSDNLGCKKLTAVPSSLCYGEACETEPREQSISESLLDVSMEELQSCEPLPPFCGTLGNMISTTEQSINLSTTNDSLDHIQPPTSSSKLQRLDLTECLLSESLLNVSDEVLKNNKPLPPLTKLGLAENPVSDIPYSVNSEIQTSSPILSESPLCGSPLSGEVLKNFELMPPLSPIPRVGETSNLSCASGHFHRSESLHDVSFEVLTNTERLSPLRSTHVIDDKRQRVTEHSGEYAKVFNRTTFFSSTPKKERRLSPVSTALSESAINLSFECVNHSVSRDTEQSIRPRRNHGSNRVISDSQTQRELSGGDILAADDFSFNDIDNSTASFIASRPEVLRENSEHLPPKPVILESPLSGDMLSVGPDALKVTGPLSPLSNISNTRPSESTQSNSLLNDSKVDPKKSQPMLLLFGTDTLEHSDSPLSDSMLSVSQDVLGNSEPLPPLSKILTDSKESQSSCASHNPHLSESLHDVSFDVLQTSKPLPPLCSTPVVYDGVPSLTYPSGERAYTSGENITPPLSSTPKRREKSMPIGYASPKPGLGSSLSFESDENMASCDTSHTSRSIDNYESKRRISGSPTPSDLIGTDISDDLPNDIDISIDLSESTGDSGSGQSDDYVCAKFNTKRKRPTKNFSVGAKYRQKTDSSSVQDTFGSNAKCCTKKCLGLVSKQLIMRCRRTYWQQNCNSRNQWLLDKMNQFSQEGRNYFVHLTPKLRVCQNAFMRVYGISRSVFFRVKSDFMKKVQIVDSFGTKRNATEATMSAIFWLEVYATSHGDRMPHKNEILLPVGTSKSELYLKYELETRKRGITVISKSHFERVWRTTLPHLKIKKQNDEFSKCNKCALFTRVLVRTTDVEKRRLIRKQRENHLQRQMNERADYYHKRNLARQFQEKYVSLIIDGMDQKKTFIPHFIGRKAKAIRTQDLIKTHITAVINHGAHQQHLFLDKGQFPHDSNMTISILLDTLWNISKRGKPLPPVLFLQADNCWRENKNKFVLAFCEILVSLEIFNEIHFSFLYVGHTHEDVDQYFSKLANVLRRNEAETLPDLLHLIPGVTEIRSVLDFKKWLSPMLNKVSGHTQPLQYKMLHNKTSANPNKVDIFYRGCCTESWKTMGSLLKTKMTQRIIAKRPENVTANMDGFDLPTLESRINTWSMMFNHADDSSLKWWGCFLEEMVSISQSERRLRLYSSRGSRWHLPHFSRCQKEQKEHRVDELLGPDLQDLLNGETQEPQVTVSGPKSTTTAKGTHGR